MLKYLYMGSSRFVEDGPCFTVADPSGNQLAVFGNVRPNALEAVRRFQETP